MPKLLEINTTLNSGSTGRIAEQIAIIAQNNGWECYIAHGARYVNTSSVKTIQIGSIVDNYIHAFLGEYLGMHGWGSKLSTLLFLRMVDKIKPDVIHLHNIHGYYLNIEYLFNYISKKNIPVVWTLHDCWSFTGHCTHFESYGCEKWKTECNHCQLLMAQYKSRLFDCTSKNFRKKKLLYSKVHDMTVVPVSNWLGALVKQSILKNCKIHVIKNGIDLNVFKPTSNDIRKRFGISENKTIVLGVVASGFGKEKGREEFKALSNYNNLAIILVGLSVADCTGFPSSVICVGRTNNQVELAQFYTAADVFLNPTYNDTFPTTNIESLACGTPVVTYKSGGSPEIIDENTGFVVDKGDVQGLLRSIDEIIKRGKSYYKVTCRERAVKYFNKDERLSEYIHVYESIINERSNIK